MFAPSQKNTVKNQIEGHLNLKLPVLVIEDLISTGKSSLNAVNSIKMLEQMLLV